MHYTFYSIFVFLWSGRKELPNVSIYFFSRSVQYIWCDYSLRLPAIEDEKGNMTYYAPQNFSGNEALWNQIVLGLYTSNVKLDTIDIAGVIKENHPLREEFIAGWPVMLTEKMTHYEPIRFFQESLIKNRMTDEPDIAMEGKIKNSYERHMNSLASSPPSGLGSPPPIAQDYRLTELKKLTITSNSTLFGIQAGLPLNPYFKIFDLDPACIFSGNKQLAADHIQTQKEINNDLSIEKWLNYRPLSATYFYFMLTSIPGEIPLNDVTFTLTMETADGEILECSSKPIKLIR
jgi:hypothetical protein